MYTEASKKREAARIAKKTARKRKKFIKKGLKSGLLKTGKDIPKGDNY